MTYGSDVWCTDRIVSGRLATGAQVVAQALYRRLITPRGTLRGGDEEAAYGIDLAAYVGSLGTDRAVAILPGIVRAELMKDDRVSDIDVAASLGMRADGTVAVILEITAALSDESEPFTLSVAASATSVALLGGVQEIAA